MDDALVAGEPESEPAALPTRQHSGDERNRDNVSYDGADGDLGSDHLPLETVDPQLLFLGLLDPYFDLSLDVNPPLDLPNSPSDSLAAKVFLLKGDLEQLITSQDGGRDLGRGGSFNEFFTAANFQHLVTIFFRRRQLLARMIHWPTFDLSKVDPGLLLSVVLCGLAYSVRTADFKGVSATLQNVADKYIFKRLKRCHNGDKSYEALEIGQAAYLITILQISRNDSTIRRKAITKRQPALIDALRRLGILNGKPIISTQQADWHGFVYCESSARLAAFASFNDGLLALFCNSPPATTIAEMQNSLPCQDELFDAGCAEDFDAELSKVGSTSQASFCIRDVVAGLLDDSWCSTTREHYDALSVFDLYAAIGGKSPALRYQHLYLVLMPRGKAFQLVLFNYRASVLPRSFDATLLRALSRWEELWQKAKQKISPEKQAWLGVAKHAPEFVLVSRKILEASAEDRQGASEYLQSTPCYDFQVFHQFILQHGSDASPR